MSMCCIKSVLRRPLISKNWESNINQVFVEPCDMEEDPTGYKAVFYIKETMGSGFDSFKSQSFAIGASYLVKRQENLQKAGYTAPMTHKAIHMIENKIGSRLSAAAA